MTHEPVLIVVHPGSCCGSANLNLGRYDARAARDGLSSELARWNGHIAVIDGDLSDDLSDYPIFNRGITDALARNASAGFKSRRIDGYAAADFDQVAAAAALVADLGLSPQANPIKLTGAWTHGEESDSGCIDDVYSTLAAAGFSVDILDSAFLLEG